MLLSCHIDRQHHCENSDRGYNSSLESTCNKGTMLDCLLEGEIQAANQENL